MKGLVAIVTGGSRGIGRAMPEIEPKRWDQLMAVNVRGPYLTCRYVLPVMIRRHRGSIINIGSRAAMTPRVEGTDYCSSKAALQMFSLCLAEEVREHNREEKKKGEDGLPIKWKEISATAKRRKEYREKGYQERLPKYMRPYQKATRKAMGLQ